MGFWVPRPTIELYIYHPLSIFSAPKLLHLCLSDDPTILSVYPIRNASNTITIYAQKDITFRCPGEIAPAATIVASWPRCWIMHRMTPAC